MTLPENREKVQALVALLSERLVGQQSHAYGKILEIIPAGSVFHGQEANLFRWRARVKQSKNATSNYVILDEFINHLELRRLFGLYFNMTGELETYPTHPYMLKENLQARVISELQPSVAIADTLDEIVIIIDWGAQQEVAFTVSDIKLYGPKLFFRHNEIYHLLLMILKVNLNRANIYIGGPPPQFEYEPVWRTDLTNVFRELECQLYDFCQIIDIRNAVVNKTKVITQTSIRFAKNRY